MIIFVCLVKGLKLFLICLQMFTILNFYHFHDFSLKEGLDLCVLFPRQISVVNKFYLYDLNFLHQLLLSQFENLLDLIFNRFKNVNAF